MIRTGEIGKALLIPAFSLLWMMVPMAHAERSREPGFVIGYATGVLQQAHSIERFTLELEDDVLLVDLESVPATALDTLGRSLGRIEGVQEVRISIGGLLASKFRVPEPSKPAAPQEGTATGDASGGGAEDASGEKAEEADAGSSSGGFDVLSPREMFEPLMADPRWPDFAASHLWYLEDDELERVGAANFGESFMLIRGPEKSWGQAELGLQAGVFSVFDLEASSADLVNSDFFVGLTATHHLGDFTTMLRIYHQSSHLGDEFLLRNRVDRINLSFEVIDLLVSFDPWQWLRLYAGGGVIVHREPRLDRGLIQGGVELESPLAFLSGFVRPVIGLDLQLRQESDWKLDASLRAGVQIEHPYLRRTRLRILGDFYSGRSPNGQFYNRRVKTVGLGMHLGF